MNRLIQFLRDVPFWQVFLEDKYRNCVLFTCVLVSNFFAALIEGISFSFILVAFSVLSNGGVLDLKMFSWLEHPLFDFISKDLIKQEVFTLFIVLSILFQVLRGSLTYLSQVYTNILSTKIQASTQKKIYAQIYRMSFPCISKFKVGDLIDYANTPNTMIFSIMDAANRFLVSFLTIVVLTVLLFLISIPLTLTMMALFIILGVLQKKIIKKISKASKQVSNHLAEYSKYTIQSLHGIRAIYTFNRQEDVKVKTYDAIEMNASACKKLNMWNSSIIPLNETIGIILVGTCLVIGPLFLKNEQVPALPLLLTFITVIYRLTTRVQALMSGFSSIAFCTGPLSRLKEILSDHDKEFIQENGNKFLEFKEEVAFKNITLYYGSSHYPALLDLSFNVKKGSFLALVGSSGAGKSSILDVLLRLYEPTSGEVLIDGVNLNTYQVGSWRDILGVVSQDTFVFNDTIVENIQFGCKNNSFEDIVEAAQIAGAHEFIIKLPEGYRTVVGERGYRLSGGERQRLALARAFLRKPSILILDEATSNLDSHSEYLIQRALETFQKDKTVIVIAHRLSTIVKADHILVLDHGRVVERGTHLELLNNNAKYAHLWHVQAGTHINQGLANIPNPYLTSYV